MEKHITLPLTEELAKTLHAGDTVYLTGEIYTSRDAKKRRSSDLRTLISPTPTGSTTMSITPPLASLR